MKLFKRKLAQGVHVITLPINQSMPLCKLFPKELSGSYIEKLDIAGNWEDKQIVVYENNHFVVASAYQALQPMQTIRLTLKREVEVNWQWEFVSNSGLIQEEITINKGFELSDALYLAQLSNLVYGEKSHILDTLKNRYLFEEAYYFSKNSHHGYFNRGIKKLLYTFIKGRSSIVDLQFTYSKKVDKKTGKQLIVVVFQGSQEELDWMTNLSMKDTDFHTRGKVHQGFYHSLKLFIKTLRKENKKIEQAILFDLFNDIQRFNMNSKIIVTGHSLGGALATLVGCYLIELGVLRDNISVYSFGAPPLATQQFCDFYDNKIDVYRMVNKNDLIPKLDKVSRLYHLGEEIILPSNEWEVHACEGYIDNIIDCMN